MPTFFSVNDKTLNGVASDSFTIDAGSDPDRVILALVMYGKSGSATTFTTPTAGGVNMVSLGGIKAVNGNTRRGELFKLEDPGSGTITVAYGTAASATWLSCVAIVLHGADAVNYVDADNHDLGSSQTPATSITPSSASSLLAAFFMGASGNNDPFTPDAGWDERRDNATSNHAWNVNTKDAAGTSLETAGTTMAVSDLWGAWVVEVTAAGAATVELTGSVAGSGTAAGTLTRIRSLMGAVASSVALTGGLTRTRVLSGSADGAAMVAGALTPIRPLSGSVDAQASIDGTLTPRRALVGGFAAASTLSGDLTRIRDLAGDAAAVGTFSGDLEIVVAGVVDISGQITAVATLQGDLVRVRDLSGDIIGQATLDGDLAPRRALAGSVDAAAALTAALTRIRNLSGSVGAEGELAAAMQVVRTLAGSMDATAVLAGDLTVGEAPPWWTPAPVGHTPAPVAYTAAPVAYAPK